MEPGLSIESSAPARVNDLGGWTDTWFSHHGGVLSLAVLPGSRCRVSASAVGGVLLKAADYGESYRFDPMNPPMERQPLLEAVISSVGVPPGTGLEVAVRSRMPPGSGTGTSASVEVALISALMRFKGEKPVADQVWKAAHRVETRVLGLESGVQDQITAAYGGACFIEIDRYPHAKVSRLQLERPVLEELQRRLVLVHLGGSRRSTEVHRLVIERLSQEGKDSPALRLLRSFAERGRDAILEGDLEAYGRIMVENNEAQRSLHPGLVSGGADAVIAVAREAGCSGWKVNGAGGEGGSLTILAGKGAAAYRRLVRAIDRLGGGIRRVPVLLDSEGFRVWEASKGV